MTFLDDCLCGRSQLFTFVDESTDKIVLDRKTFEQILDFVNHSTDILARIRSNEIFLHSLGTYLSEFDSLDDVGLLKASLLLCAWDENVSCDFKQLSEELNEAAVITSVVWAASRLGGLNCD
ncbi:hypothetical protein QUA82_15635 [Microcoleus sp. F8-D3]